MNAGDLDYRRARANDARALAALRYQFRTQLADPQETQSQFIDRCGAWMEARLSGSAWLAWLAEHQGRIIAQIWLHSIEKIPNPVAEHETNAYITNAFVLPEFRARGVGGELLRLALQWCADARVDRVVLWPTKRSRPLYARHGFKVDNDMMELRMAGDHHHEPRSGAP
ncbi:MAG: GNAT family N-acetyltransferase [Longimicrobiales bacterium]